MIHQGLELETRGQVAYVWMNRPEVHNALDETIIRELTETFQTLDKDPNVRVVVLAGRGKSFSAGADLGWMKRAAAYTEAENQRDALALGQMLNTIYMLSKPTLARVHGAALGGGLGLATVCDIAVAATSAQFALSEVRLGLIPATIGPYVIAAIGTRAAHRYFLTGERFEAQEARRIGVVHEVIADEAIDRRIGEIVDTLLAGGPHAQAAAKTLIDRVAPRSINEEVVEHTANEIARLRATPEAREGIGAFLEKRRPSWMK
ncbi:MAG: enoyl-CoA hydratase/isomerase family protein [Gammaproteobacteria bacterium]|nr:enoyl-CoA hydratase/isomerase family protein [Gammaproteobacteria bacterium]